MYFSSEEIETILNLLAETPGRIQSMVEGTRSTSLHTRPDEDSWSVTDILAHLRACGDVWGKSIQVMINQDHPTLRYVSPRTWIRKTDYPDQEFGALLQAFTRQRKDLLQILKTLAPEGWSRGATFTGTTRGREQTVMSYAQRLARHENEHCEQIEQLLNR